MRSFSLKNVSLAAAVAAFGLASLAAPDASQAMGDPPKPKPSVDCSKQANKSKPQCKNPSNTDEIYNSGYWLAKSGKYEQAITVLKTADNQHDPRILNYLGFANRKLGKVDEALGYYAKALAADPNYTVARAYLGEAYLQKGDAPKAKEQLVEIEKRCGKACAEFAELEGHIKSFETTGKHSG